MRKQWIVTATLALVLATLLTAPVMGAAPNRKPTSPTICYWSTVASNSAPFIVLSQVGTLNVAIEQENSTCATREFRTHAWTTATQSPNGVCYSVNVDPRLNDNGITALDGPSATGAIGASGNSCAAGTQLDAYTGAYRANSGDNLVGVNITTYNNSTTSVTASYKVS